MGQLRASNMCEFVVYGREPFVIVRSMGLRNVISRLRAVSPAPLHGNQVLTKLGNASCRVHASSRITEVLQFKAYQNFIQVSHDNATAVPHELERVAAPALAWAGKIGRAHV